MEQEAGPVDIAVEQEGDVFTPMAWNDKSFQSTGYFSSKFCDAGVDFVLWGPDMMLLLGIPDVIGSCSEFVVSDAHYDKAIDVLRGLGGEVCDSGRCEWSWHSHLGKRNYMRPWTIFAPVHLRKEGKDCEVLLHKHSDMLWHLPSLKPDGENVLIADDKKLGWHRFGMHGGEQGPMSMPTRVPAAHHVVEACVRLYVRDSGLFSRFEWRLWILQLLDKNRMFGEVRLDLLEPHFREFVRDLALQSTAIYVHAYLKLVAADPSLKSRPLPQVEHSFRRYSYFGTWTEPEDRTDEEDLREYGLL